MEKLYTVTACSVGLLTFSLVVYKWHFSKRSSGPEDSKEDVKEISKPGDGSDWEWPLYDEFEDQFGSSELKKREPKSTEDEDEGPFRVIYRRKAHQLWPDAVQVTLFSVPLARILQRYLPSDGELKSAAEPKVDGRHLFAVLDDLKRHVPAGHANVLEEVTPNGSSIDASNHAALANGDSGVGALSNGDVPSRSDGANGQDGEVTPGEVADKKNDDAKDAAAGEQHLAHLVRFLSAEYGECTVRMQRMKDEKRASWDMLWAVIPRNSRVVYRCENSEELLYAVVSGTYYHYNEYQPIGWWFLIELDMWDYDGKTWRQCQIRRQIAKYDGERSFINLAVCPVETFGSQDAMEAKFKDNGTKFYDLCVKESNRFMLYTGPIFQKTQVGGCWQLVKDNADGRVMVDLSSFAKMNPGYPMGTAESQTDTFWVSPGNRRGGFEFSGTEQRLFSSDSESVEQNLMFAPAIVYGFSFSLKRWGAFAVNGFQEVAFDSGAFKELVMEPDLKRLIYNLVTQYIGPSNDGAKLGLRELKRVDPISRKGEGCVFLCYGPPGTGKTLTAESIAEDMRRPLWALSVSELGTTPNDLEQTLLKVLDIASTWRAVLLLDEADVYLEKRSSGADVTRNALTGVFLRLLEYYKGVLFLTTNRIGTFDEAFRSRISVFLSYSKLGTEHKEQVWTTLLKRAGVNGVTSASIADFAAQDLNGREIRNVIHTAAVWAKSNGEVAAEKHVKYVVDISKGALETLDRALHNSAEN